MTPGLRKTLHWLGSGLALAGVVFVIVRLIQYSGQIDFSAIGAGIWLGVGATALVYALDNLLLAGAWKQLLKQLGVEVSSGLAVRIYGISQLAKYLPGNIFHLAGRQALGMAVEVDGKALAKSTLWELVLLCVAGGAFGLLVLPLISDVLKPLSAQLLFAVVFSLLAVLISHLLGKNAAVAFLCYGFFLIVSGGIFVALLSLLGDVALGDWWMLAGAFVIAWLAGLLTPGAPAGVGVRELVLFFLLKATVSEADLLLAIVLGRIVTVLGDALFYLAALVTGQSTARLTS